MQQIEEEIKGQKPSERTQVIQENKDKIIKIKKEIAITNDFIQRNQIILAKVSLNDVPEQIKNLKTVIEIDCVKFAYNPGKGYEYSALQKVFHLRDFASQVLECGSRTPQLKDTIKQVKDKFNKVANINKTLIENIIDGEITQIVSDLLLRLGGGSFYFVKFLVALARKKRYCTYGEITKCIFQRGIVLGYGIKFALTLFGSF